MPPACGLPGAEIARGAHRVASPALLWTLVKSAFISLPLFATRAEEPPPFTLDEVVVHVPRSEASDATAAASVVKAERFAGEAKTVAELVATAPGVAVHEYGGLGQLSTVSIRGSSADQVAVFLDGLPLNTAAGGGVDLSRIPRAWIERIEVIRGTAGAYYGSGALGGVVNIVTRPAAAGAWSAETSAGSFGTYSGSADGAIGGPRWGLLGAASLDDTSGRFSYLFNPRPALSGNDLEPRTREHNASLSAGSLAKLWADLGRGRLDAVVQLSGGVRNLPGSPYAPTPSDGQHDLRIGTVVRFAHPISDELHVALEASGRDDRLSVQISPVPRSCQDDLAGTVGSQLTWLAGRSTLTLRALTGTESLATEGSATRERGSLALAASGELALFADGRLLVAPALRWERIGAQGGLSGNLGVRARLVGPLSIRASGGRTFRVPSFAELYLQQGLLSPNPELVPEEAWSADASLVAEGALGMASLGGFGTLYRDIIVYEADSFRRMKPFNDGTATANGLEAELASTPIGPAAITGSAAYTLLATETLLGNESVLGKDLPHRPRHRLFARLGAGYGPLEVHGEAHYVSSQFLDLANSPSLTVPAALTFNLGCSLRLLRRPETRLSLEVRNLLDNRTLQDGFGNPLPGRMVMVTLRVTGGKEGTAP